MVKIATVNVIFQIVMDCWVVELLRLQEIGKVVILVEIVAVINNNIKKINMANKRTKSSLDYYYTKKDEIIDFFQEKGNISAEETDLEKINEV